ncbi:NADH:ubiquinone oxidoreductase [Lithohypha guttulata]|uniref:NADH:ubiquinone oxidoreductase n=1 Tax=Lithohypha guttulata TaxID=1690604 RepID=A0AAN7SXS0_9EURO|nr:NADH:ubiquinone oxidoreductase [Lithohypha guttulata]KAK5102916.1 NADH:ubiquinone oxidoreductase [Lithohypha guttulata]
MTGSDRSLPSSPAPGASPEESLKFYKTQYEFLEAELAEFQASSKDLEAELERDVEQAEKRERQLKEQAADLRYQVDEWKEKHKQAKSEGATAQALLEREIKNLRQENLTLRQRVRDIEVANDDYERKQRTTEVSLEDMESRYNQAVERAVMMEEEVKGGEQERESLRIETQRLKDEFSDFRIETDVVRKKLERAEEELAVKRRSLTINPHIVAASPRSELSPTTTDASAPSFDTPPAKTKTSSSISDAPTPPSPPASNKMAVNTPSFATPAPVKTRSSIGAIPRQPPLSAKGHARGASVATMGRPQPNSTYRQSLGKPLTTGRQSIIPSGLPQSSSIVQLRNLRGKMQSLEERVHKARSRLPGPADTPPRGSPRSGSALSSHMPASVTMRSKRKTGSIFSAQDSEETPSTPSATRTRPSRPSLTGRPASPVRTSMAAPPRPSSRASAVSTRTSMSQFQPGHSRPASRASISGLRTLANGHHAPNASTDRVRPHSSLSSHGGYDGTFEEEPELDSTVSSQVNATPRRTTYTKRVSDVSSGIPTPGTTKRHSLGGGSRLPALTRRQSGGVVPTEGRPPSRQVLDGVKEGFQDDDNETF